MKSRLLISGNLFGLLLDYFIDLNANMLLNYLKY